MACYLCECAVHSHHGWKLQVESMYNECFVIYLEYYNGGSTKTLLLPISSDTKMSLWDINHDTVTTWCQNIEKPILCATTCNVSIGAVPVTAIRTRTIITNY